MKSKKMTRIIASVVMILLPCVANAQMSNTLFFDKQNLRQHKVNPAAQPIGKFYVGMPGISTIAISGGNSRFTFDDLVENKEVNGEVRTLLFMDKNADGMQNFLDKLKFKERVYASYRVDLLDFGFSIKEKGFFTFGLSNRMETMLILPHQIPSIIFGGMNNHEVYDFRMNRLSVSSTLFSEIAAGYSHKINDKLSIGGKFKFLLGHLNAYTDFYDLDLMATEDEWHFKGDASIHGSVPGLRFVPNDKHQFGEVEFDEDQPIRSYIKPRGSGMAIDLGMTYQILPELKVSASVLDLGFIRWRKDLVQLDKNGDVVYNGVEFDINDDSTKYYEHYGDELENLYVINDHPEKYGSALSTKLNVGAEYSLWEDRVGFGFLSTTYFFRRTAWEEFLISTNFRPCKYVSLTLSYNMFDGEWNNLNAGMNLNLGPVNLYAALDHIPLKFAKIDEYKIPSNTRSVRANVGLAFLFGTKKRDRDKDGVPDKYDKCPDTLPGVEVDDAGCPKDKDKDGVPDYLDKCPDTPKGVNVDPLGCPVDDDGDGVADYLDYCPSTPYGVKVDSKGCPIDTDGDGVPDYLDKCPDTPEGANVDSLGCPVDTDGDGVFDYLDKCADTPEGVKVDSLGCPIDTDGDGVPDYLDNCPEEAGVDSNKGCPEINMKQVFKKALTGIQFETGKSIIKKSSYPILNDIAKIMKNNPSYKLNIVGHTDNVGNPKWNKKLSLSRANSVKNYLKRKGVAASRMETSGLGDTMPIKTNKTAAGRAKNRRVEFEVEY